MESGKSKAEEIVRRQRIILYKKIIIAIIILLLLIPIIISSFLLYRVNKLENIVNSLISQQKNNYDSIEAEVQNTDPKEVELKKVYLTFDDGPSENTDDILKILDEYNIKATFFVIGKTDQESLELYKDIVEAGHSIGLHSYSHNYKEVYSSVESFKEEFSELRQLINQTTGTDTHLIRFPGGSSTTLTNAVPMKDFIDFANNEGYTYFDWNISSGDGAVNIDSQQIINNVISNVDNFEVPVILMHDGNNKNTTVEALPEIISALIQKGYKPCAIDDTVIPVHHVIE